MPSKFTIIKNERSFLFYGGITKMLKNRAILATMIFLLAAAMVYGQGTTGQLSGTVTDPNGAVVSGAAVKVTSMETNLTREATAGSDGSFSVQLLPPGRYRIEVSASNFSTQTVEAVVNITQTTSVNVQLGIGIDGGQVTIEADAPVIQTETSQQGRVVTGETLRQLPLPTRNFQQLFRPERRQMFRIRQNLAAATR